MSVTALKLKGCELFAGMSEAGLHAIASRCEERQFARGQWLFRAGDTGDGLFVLDSGLVEVVYEQGSGGPKVLDQLESGDSFGELALVRGAPRLISARASAAAVC